MDTLKLVVNLAGSIVLSSQIPLIISIITFEGSQRYGKKMTIYNSKRSLHVVWDINSNDNCQSVQLINQDLSQVLRQFKH